MSFNLDHIDELKRRANVSYADAREALIQCNGDLLEALVYLEGQNKIKPEPQESTLLSKMKTLFNKGNNTRFVIKKKERTVLNLSVTITVLITVFTFHITVPVLLLALVTGHKMKFEGKNGEDLKVNKTLHKVSEAVDNAKKKLVEEDPHTATQ
ncbi:DUF4342 domain-containing protein [Desulforamulus ruminis]|uniref:Ubiquitin-associated-domain-containing protein n=1 Tax=Desulforamulus ruminis (strain ATCC 23193 / DSM 2154 / NCIMB 8452 / DL) TaxID=696281 RepID=F6DRL4_DESRL|nr:DUF4342 domain-containing protein [Desulforamulus ruminis]AEG58768.1 ubiquitin-associated- domain-containing protein [Desulforamulus ruminis DSM 2154]